MVLCKKVSAKFINLHEQLALDNSRTVYEHVINDVFMGVMSSFMSKFTN